ncbi:hypothetical protein G9A89_001818 [Geosiphon pyriformis]|nr:hypothetical protein G9A89_001818 [Geosiphon pyriformis]
MIMYNLKKNPKLPNLLAWFVLIVLVIISFTDIIDFGVEGAPFDLKVQGIDYTTSPLGLVTKRDAIDPKCSEFKLSIPVPKTARNRIPLFRKEDRITVKFLKGASMVYKVVDLELFNNKGLLQIIADGPWFFDQSGNMSRTFILKPPVGNSSAKFGKVNSEDYQFKIRSWGSTLEGPHCISFSNPFYIAAP